MFRTPGACFFIRQNSLVQGTSPDRVGAETASSPAWYTRKSMSGKFRAALMMSRGWVVVVPRPPEGQSLVPAPPPPPGLSGPLEHGVGDLLVLPEPAAVEPLGGG